MGHQTYPSQIVYYEYPTIHEPAVVCSMHNIHVTYMLLIPDHITMFYLTRVTLLHTATHCYYLDEVVAVVGSAPKWDPSWPPFYTLVHPCLCCTHNDCVEISWTVCYRRITNQDILLIQWTALQTPPLRLPWTFKYLGSLTTISLLCIQSQKETLLQSLGRWTIAVERTFIDLVQFGHWQTDRLPRTDPSDVGLSVCLSVCLCFCPTLPVLHFCLSVCLYVIRCVFCIW